MLIIEILTIMPESPFADAIGRGSTADPLPQQTLYFTGNTSRCRGDGEASTPLEGDRPPHLEPGSGTELL